MRLTAVRMTILKCAIVTDTKKQQRMYLKLVERYQKLGIIRGVSASEKGNIIKFELEKNAII